MGNAPTASPPETPLLCDDGAVRDSSVLSRRNFLRAAAFGVLASSHTISTGAEESHENSSYEKLMAKRTWYREAHPAEGVILQRKEFYPYKSSVLLQYVKAEKTALPHHKYADLAVIVADNIADQTAHRTYDAMKKGLQTEGRGNESPTMDQALRWVNETEHNMRVYIGRIAEALGEAGCYFNVEHYFHRGMNPNLPAHEHQAFHLDCDLLSYLALHCACRHDISLHAVLAPRHVYIGSPKFPDFVAEMTWFRAIPIHRTDSAGNYSCNVISNHEIQKASFPDPNPDDARNDYYKGMDEEDIKKWVGIGVGDRDTDVGIFDPSAGPNGANYKHSADMIQIPQEPY